MAPQVLQGQPVEISASGKPLLDDPADDLMRLAEGHAMFREVVGEVGGSEHAPIGCASHRRAIEAHSTKRGGENDERRRDLSGVI